MCRLMSPARMRKTFKKGLRVKKKFKTFQSLELSGLSSVSHGNCQKTLKVPNTTNTPEFGVMLQAS